MTEQFVEVTEIDGQSISAEQLFRTCHRYRWAEQYVIGKDVLEVACGAGQGLGILKSSAKSLEAGDISPEVLDVARQTYGASVALSVFGAENLPFEDNSFDVALLFEAIYYVPDPGRFFREAKRVLRKGGKLLIVTANKDLYDFTPSPYSHRYLGVVELAEELAAEGFECDFAGLISIDEVSLRQRCLRPVKSMASKLGLIPKTMKGKVWLKRLFFGEMTTMPADIEGIAIDYISPRAIANDVPDLTHKVIYCSARAI